MNKNSYHNSNYFTIYIGNVFPNDMAVFKIFYLAIENITKKWTLPIQNWNTAIAHFMIKFEDRINLN